MRIRNDKVAECVSEEHQEFGGATRRKILICKWYITMYCGEELLN